MSITIGSGISLGAGITTTSVPLPIRYAYVFDGASWFDLLGNTADWAFGNTGTIEFWINPTRSSAESPGGFLGAIMTQENGGGQGIDSWIAGGLAVAWGSNNYGVYPEPTKLIWTHVAYVFNGIGVPGVVYINGTATSLIGGFVEYGQFYDSTQTLTVGKRGPDVPFQYISAMMSDIRINTTAVYTSNFVPPAAPLTDIPGTVLLMAGDSLVDQTGRHTISNYGVTVIADGNY